MAETQIDPIARLFAQVLALRLIVQDLLGRQAAASNDFTGFLRQKHAHILDDLTRVRLDGKNLEIDQAILMHVEAAIDQIFAPILSGPPPENQ